MKNLGSGSSPTVGTRPRHTKQARRTASSVAHGAKTPFPKKPDGKRFVEPYRLGTEQRCAMLSALKKRKIGDEESRALFAAALEYALAVYHQSPSPTEPSSTTSPERRSTIENPVVSALTEAAGSLVQQIEKLGDTASRLLEQELEKEDRFRRSYSEEYLKSLDLALRRFAVIGKPVVENAPTASDASGPAENARRFVLHAADAFQDCFELAPDSEPGSPFPAALEAIGGIVGMGIPTDSATLNRILGND
jgi:hypothetical protein